MRRQATRLRDGRQIVLARGKKTQTINVCTPDDRAGDYEHVFRLPIAEDVDLAELAQQADTAALSDWAVGHGGVEEQSNGRKGRAVLPLVEVEEDRAWLTAATLAVETVLDDVVAEFVERPYLHRVEHSLHAEIYLRLKGHDVLSGEFPLLSGDEMTQLVHKEWPETRPDLSVGASGRRGALDLAVVSPQALAAASLKQFRQGRIAASIVVEVGLDYGQKHLLDDGKKMLDWNVTAAYLLHLLRVRDVNASAIEAYANNPPGNLRVAYVHHDPGVGTRSKNLSDNEVHPAKAALT